MTKPPFSTIDHIQLAIPVGGEDIARKFYVDLLGLTEIPKPADMAKRGGCWFESGSVQVHLGIEDDYKPSKKAHPAFCCNDFDALVDRLISSGVQVKQADGIPGVKRCHILDPFGNRIELIEAKAT